MTRRILTAVVLALIATLSTTTTTSAAEASGSRLLVYGHHDMGVTIQRAPKVARKLHGAPVGFKNFVRRTLRHLQRSAGCSGSFVGVTVNRVRTDGFARGGVNQCGGYAAIWKKVSGHWRQVLGTQDIWSCQDLQHWSIPSSVVAPNPRCYDGSDVVAYSHP